MATESDTTPNGDHSTPPTGAYQRLEKTQIEQSISDRFEHQVRSYPDKLAVKTTRDMASYSQLNQLANQIGRLILQNCEEHNIPVALLLEQGTLLIAAILGALKAGKIYVPLDPKHRPSRNAEILLDSTASLILTDSLNLNRANELKAQGASLLNLDKIDNDLSTEDLNLPISPDWLAYIFYTSGSTGQPKGVTDSHRNVLHNIMRYTNSLRISANDRLTLLQSSSFSGSVSSLFSALLNGATSFPLDLQEAGPNRLASWVDQENITIYHSVPSIFRLIATGEHSYPSLRIIRLEGDQANPKDLHLFRKYFPDTCILVNGLGATECGIVRQYFFNNQQPLPESVVPIGYEVEDMEILLFDESGQQVGYDCVGQIGVRSRYLATGYWRRPDLTEAAFREDSKDQEIRTYLTGDLGRMRADGCLEYLGRNDFHLKIRGQWVEIPQVERTLREFRAFQDVVVITRQDPGYEPRLVAYLVPNTENVPKTDAIRRHLSQLLPDHMIPSAFVMMNELPLNSFGKIDRATLPPPSKDRPELEHAYVPPQGSLLQLRLTQIWEEVLQVRPVGFKDIFFDLGGDSFLAVDMLARVERSTGCRVPPEVLLAKPTVESISNYLLGHAGALEAPIVQLQSNGSRRPFFFLHGDYISGGFYCYSLARHLGTDQPFFALPPCGVNGHSVTGSYQEMARFHLRVLRDQQPVGPYQLGGTCNGGLVAYEMARQLAEEGEKVAALILIAASARNLRFRALRRFLSPLKLISKRMEFIVSTRLQMFWTNMTRLPLSQQPRFVLSKLPKLVEVLRILTSKQAADEGTSTAGSDIENKSYNASRAHLRETYLRIDQGYMPELYSGKVTLLWSEGEDESPDEAIHWWKHAVKEVHLLKLPGSPHTLSLTKHVEGVAEILRSCLY